MNFKKHVALFSTIVVITTSIPLTSFAEGQLIPVPKNLNPITMYTEHNITTRSVGHAKDKIFVKKVNLKKQFVGYCTSSWVKADSYGRGSSYDFSGSLSYQGASFSVGYSQSITANIPANPNKYSKLAGYADIDLSIYHVKEYIGGTLSKEYDLAEPKIRDTYVEVVYK